MVSILWLLEVLTWTLGFCNVKIAENGVIPRSHVESKRPNVSSTIGLTSLKIIMSLVVIAKLTQRRILLILKLRKENCALTLSSALIVKVIIKQIWIHVPFGDIGSTENSTRRNTLRSVKTGPNQFVQSWTTNLNNDLWLFKGFLSECLEEFANHQYYPWDSNRFQYYLYPRTAMISHLHNTKCFKSRRQNSSWDNSPP